MKRISFAAALLSVMLSTASLAQMSAEIAAVDQFHKLRDSNKAPTTSEQWVQPSNHTEKCAMRLGGSGSEVPTSAKWYGNCVKGRANGLGVGVFTFNGPVKSMVALEEYTGPQSEEDINYRQITETQEGTFIFSGKVDGDEIIGQVLRIGRSSQGVTRLELLRQKCQGGECVAQLVDSFTGSIAYSMTGTSGYAVTWNDARVNNVPMFSYRVFTVNGVDRVRKTIVDGGVFDVATDIQSGRSFQTTFNSDLNAILAWPFEKYTSIAEQIDDALTVSNEKFIAAHKRFCIAGKVKVKDIKMVCDSSSLTPSETEMAAAKEQANRVIETAYNRYHAEAVASSTRANNYAAAQEQHNAQQEQLIAQQEQINQLKRQQDQQALRQGLSALNQVGKDFQNAAQQMTNQSNQYKPPQVEQYSPHSPPIAHCRTIGYITTCN